MFTTLVVDDSAAFRKSLAELLCVRFPAIRVAQAKTASEAWKMLVEIQPALVFTTIRLRDGNGLDLIRGIRKACADVVVAVIASYDLPEYREAAYRNGAHCFIPKDSASSSDILMLIESIQMGRPPRWSDPFRSAPKVRIATREGSPSSRWFDICRRRGNHSH